MFVTQLARWLSNCHYHYIIPTVVPYSVPCVVTTQNGAAAASIQQCCVEECQIMSSVSLLSQQLHVVARYTHNAVELVAAKPRIYTHN